MFPVACNGWNRSTLRTKICPPPVPLLASPEYSLEEANIAAR